MKILMTAYSCEPGRGSEEGVGWNFARQAAKRNEVYLITRENNVPSIEEAVRREGLTGLKVVGFDLPPWMRFWKKKRRGAVPYFYLWTLTAGLMARRLDRVVGFDLVHSTTFVSSWIPSGLVFVDKPLVWGPVGQHPKIPAQFLIEAPRGVRVNEALRAGLKACLPKIDPLLRHTMRRAALTLSLGSEFERRGRPRGCGPIVRMPAIGVDTIYSPLPHDGTTLLFAGRLVEMKAPRLALKAFARAKVWDSSLTMTFLGSGPLRGRLEELAVNLGVADAVHFLGHVPFEGVTNYFRRADIFLFPSFEGAGMVVPEAMAAGALVVCLDFGGPGDMTEGGRGIACKVEDTEDETAKGIATELLKILSDPKRGERIRATAQAWVTSTMLWDRKGEQLQAEYERVLRRVLAV